MMDPPEGMLDQVRRRPGMWFGSTGSGALRALVMEVVSNSLDEVLAGRASALSVTIHGDRSVTVSDDGRGIGTVIDEGALVAIRRVLTSFHNSPTADGHEPHVHLAFGAGLGPVCAVCARVDVEVVTERVVGSVSFERGIEVSAFEQPNLDRPSGTTIRLWPDPEIFVPLRWNIGLVQSELVTLSQLLPGLTVHFSIEPQTYGPEDDLSGLFREVKGWGELLHDDPILITADDGANRVRLAIGWTDSTYAVASIHSFCNLRPTEEGGSHVQGIEEGLRLVFGQGPTTGLMTGLVAVLHVLLLEPNFAGPTKGRLDSTEAIWLVANAIGEQLPEQLDARPWLRDRLRGRLTPPP